MPMFIIQGLLNTPSLVLYGSKNRLKTCERFALLDPRIPMRGAGLTALLPFYRMRRLLIEAKWSKRSLDFLGFTMMLNFNKIIIFLLKLIKNMSASVYCLCYQIVSIRIYRLCCNFNLYLCIVIINRIL